MIGVFILGGVVLIASGVLQLFIRPRDPGRAKAARLLDAGTVRSIFFVLMGLLVLLVGLRVIPLEIPGL